ncbi:fibronectin type III domain-containing protein [Halobacteria archaeon AArc-m2/3/4]|uniref:Fibronectin type III domain-containing protein n=1 Tax=Natronoglomus mannanivorans TaxID=2979990 RepID=A0ABT2QFA8_9EURY|nr:fibronectin type III domain-containing protein [Halobacteria archaeon AArc-m2/3/4]
MNEQHQQSDRRTAPTTENETNPNGERGRARTVSRRRLLKATAVGSASALAFGVGAGASSGTVAGQTVVEERCGSTDHLTVGDGNGVLINNDWSTSQVPQEPHMCVFRNDDGSYGWEWERGETDACPEDCPDYPEVLIGNKPWSSSSQTHLFPTQIGDVDELAVDLDIDNGASGEEWNLALEWWYTDTQPPIGGGDPTHEIMLILEKSDSHTKGESIEDGAITDSYGNVIDHWEHVTDRLEWSFHIFKLAANEVPSNVDLRSILDYLDEYDDDPDGFPPDRWMTGIEIGNETWDHSEGRTTVHDFDVRLNGETATTGVDSEFTEDPVETTPTAPSNLEVTSRTETSVSVMWDASSDGETEAEVEVDHYVVSVDGLEDGEQLASDTTSTTVSGLSPDTTYEIAVTAVDDAGNESSESTVSVRTDGDDPEEPPAIDGNTPQDTTGDGRYNDVTGSGQTTTTDVNVFFEHVDDPAVTDYPEYYDFTGNDRVSVSDVVELFESI